MIGRKVEQLYPDRPAAARRRRCSRSRGLTRAPDVHDVSFTVRAGEVLGIGGLVGAGRTELLRLIYGLDRPDAGHGHVDGRRLPAGPARARRSPPASAWRRRTASRRACCSTGA